MESPVIRKDAEFEYKRIKSIYKQDLFYILYRKRARENFHTLFFTMIKTQLHIVQVKQEVYQVEIP